MSWQPGGSGPFLYQGAWQKPQQERWKLSEHPQQEEYYTSSGALATRQDYEGYANQPYSQDRQEAHPPWEQHQKEKDSQHLERYDQYSDQQGGWEQQEYREGRYREQRQYAEQQHEQQFREQREPFGEQGWSEQQQLDPTAKPAEDPYSEDWSAVQGTVGDITQEESVVIESVIDQQPTNEKAEEAVVDLTEPSVEEPQTVEPTEEIQPEPSEYFTS